MNLWFMDTDFCDRCDGLLDRWGICSECGYDGVDYEEYEEDDEYIVDEWWEE